MFNAQVVYDVLTPQATKVNTTTYTNFEYVSASSNVVYAGMVAGSNDYIQMRSTNNNCGIITRESGRRAVSVSVDWNSKTLSGTSARNIVVYASEKPYSSAADLYNEGTYGTLIGKIGSSDPKATIEIPGGYSYVGIRSESGALYVSSITFAWDDMTSGGGSITNPTDSTITNPTDSTITNPTDSIITNPTDSRPPVRNS